MENSMCRICLEENIRMLDIADLRYIYEKLTELPFITETPLPLKACYICHALLKNCQHLMKKCHQSEQILKNMLNGIQLQDSTKKVSNFKSLIISPVSHINISDSSDVNVKKEVEIPIVSDLALKEELEHKEEPYYYPIADPLEDNNIFEIEYEPRSDVEDNTPLTEFASKELIVEQLSTSRGHKSKYKERSSTSNKFKHKNAKLKTDETKTDMKCIKVEQMTIPCEPHNVGADDIQQYANYTTDLKDWAQTSIKVKIESVQDDFCSYQDCDKPKDYKSSKKRKRKIKREPGATKRKPSDNRSLACPICEKRFSYNSNLKYHLYTHTGERPYQCDMCGKGFAQNKQLKNHILTHTGEKPFKCHLCSNSFHIKNSLRNHYRVHSTETPFKCESCPREFKEKSSLIKHIRTHTGEKPYQCDQCPSSFKLCHTLKNHMRTHTGEKPYKCSFCEMCFSKDSNLKAHIRIHTGERPYVCEICQRSFNQKSALNTHKRTHEKHNKKVDYFIGRMPLMSSGGENSNSTTYEKVDEILDRTPLNMSGENRNST